MREYMRAYLWGSVKTKCVKSKVVLVQDNDAVCAFQLEKIKSATNGWDVASLGLECPAVGQFEMESKEPGS